MNSIHGKKIGNLLPIEQKFIPFGFSLKYLCQLVYDDAVTMVKRIADAEYQKEMTQAPHFYCSFINGPQPIVYKNLYLQTCLHSVILDANMERRKL